MKKIILYGLVIVGLAACKKSNEPDQRPDERLSAALTAYQTQLSSAENGWIAYLFPKGGGGYTFKFKFDSKNRVTTYSDQDEETSSTPRESSYRLKATQLPSLYFDTYTYLHVLADPDPNISGGVSGSGKSSDFEFSFLSSSPDTIKLKGYLNGSSMILIRAKATEGDDFIARAYAYNQNLAKVNNLQYYYNKITSGNKDYNITINADLHTVSFYYDQEGFKRFTTEYATGANGIVFRDPFVNGATSISEFHDVAINIATGTTELTAGTTKLTMTNVATPLTFDKTAPSRMYTASYQYTSDHAFTKSGVEDAFNLKNIPGFVGVLFVANQFTNPLDAFWVYYNGGATRYGPVFNTRLDADGKMVFVRSAFGNQGTNPGAANVLLVNAAYAQLADAGGYYAFETGVNSYDLVSVADGRNWIRFY